MVKINFRLDSTSSQKEILKFSFDSAEHSETKMSLIIWPICPNCMWLCVNLKWVKSTRPILENAKYIRYGPSHWSLFSFFSSFKISLFQNSFRKTATDWNKSKWAKNTKELFFKFTMTHNIWPTISFKEIIFFPVFNYL